MSVLPCILLTELVLTSFFQADQLETMMWDQFVIQEQMDCCLDSTSEELQQLCSQSQEDGAKMAALSLQLQEVMSSFEVRSEVVGRNLEELNGCFDCHRGKINCLKTREKELKERVEELGGYIIGAGHKAKIFKDQLDWMEDPHLLVWAYSFRSWGGVCIFRGRG